MAKAKLGANISKMLDKTVKKSNEAANLPQFLFLSSADLIDYPDNNEDISDTTDLEHSMRELGFTDPIEVTDFNQPAGKYMIVSGHRRRAAAIKVDIDLIPCIVRTFDNEDDVRNAVLLSNSQRDSSKDPLLFAKRYKMHEAHLLSIGRDKKGIRPEIAQRLGISTQQADRYNQFNRIIQPVWELVRHEKVGMASVLGMAQLSEDQQSDVYNMLVECMDRGHTLTRAFCDKLIKGFRSGIKSIDEILKPAAEQPEPAAEQPEPAAEQPEPAAEQPEPAAEQSEPAAEQPEPAAEQSEPAAEQPEPAAEQPEPAGDSSGKAFDKIVNGSTAKQSKSEDKELENSRSILDSVARLEAKMNNIYAFRNKDDAKAMVKTLAGFVSFLCEEIRQIGMVESISYMKELTDIQNDVHEFLKSASKQNSDK